MKKKKTEIEKKEILRETIASEGVKLKDSVSESSFIKIADSVDLSKLTDGDKQPMFVTVEVLHEGVSRNKTYYDREAIEAIKEQILSSKPNAIRGHIKQEDYNSANPEVETIWIGAGTKTVNGKLALFAKGYVLPTAKFMRTYLKKAVAVGKNVPVSVYFEAKRVFDKAIQAYRVAEIELSQIDWARQGREGVPSLTGVTVLSSEMANNLNDDQEMKFEDLTIEILKEKRADLVEGIQSEAKAVVSEMATDLGIEADKLKETVSEMASELTSVKQENQNLLKSSKELEAKEILREKISNKAIRAVVQEMVLPYVSLDSDVKEVVKEQLESERVKSVLALKKDTSVSPQVEESFSNGMTKIVSK